MTELPFEFDPSKDMDNLIDDIESYLKMPLEDKTPSSFRECEHKKVFLDAQNRTVTCQECKKQLDPFWYLLLLAKEWRIRRYQDVEAIRAYRSLVEKDRQREARGKHFVRPQSGEGQKVWDAYVELNGKPPDYVRALGKYWYVGEGDGWTLGDYIKQLVADKYRRMGMEPPQCCA